MIEFEPLFEPTSIAVVGVSRDPSKTSGIVFRYLRDTQARVYPINPGTSEIDGVRAYPCLEQVPEPVDLAVILTPAGAVAEVLRSCVRCGTRAAIVIAGGFGEASEDGRRMEHEMRRILHGSSLRLLGPNTLGMLVPKSRLDTMFVLRERALRPEPGPVAFISQSGATGCARMSVAASEGMGLHSFVGLGNRVDITESEIMLYLAEQPDVKCIAVYLESFADGGAFFEAARSITLETPVCLVKAGRSPAGARAAALHTGSLAAGDRVINGVMKQVGVYRVLDDEALLDIAWALAWAPLPRGDRVAIVGCAGGHGVMLADYLEGGENSIGARVARLSPATQAALRLAALPFASVENPVDLTGSGTTEMYERALAVLEEAPEVDAVICSVQLEAPLLDDQILNVVTRCAQASRKPFLVCAVGAEASLEVRRHLNRAGIPAYPSLWRATRALGALIERARWLDPAGFRTDTPAPESRQAARAN